MLPLDPDSKRAYTAKAEGFREFRGGILQLASPQVEINLRDDL
jgi:hypothetical protein